jgi:hypothetical protein
LEKMRSATRSMKSGSEAGWAPHPLPPPPKSS